VGKRWWGAGDKPLGAIAERLSRGYSRCVKERLQMRLGGRDSRCWEVIVRLQRDQTLGIAQLTVSSLSSKIVRRRKLQRWCLEGR
ncbi:hypothetical protein B296_00021231, partial [Ensete ventricosum]